LIREVTELQAKAESTDLTDANQRLETQVQQLKTENGQQKTQFESKNQKLQDDLNDQKQEIGRLQKSHEHELTRLNGELRKFQKELEVKDAAFQSLKLAKPVSLKSKISLKQQILVIQRRHPGTRAGQTENRTCSAITRECAVVGTENGTRTIQKPTFF
jgi:predicted RNase H-like nuclease (RuvC/YqgF family)